MTEISTVNFTVEAEDGYYGKIVRFMSEYPSDSFEYKYVYDKIMNKPVKIGQLAVEPGTSANAYNVFSRMNGEDNVIVNGDISYPDPINSDYIY